MALVSRAQPYIPTYRNLRHRISLLGTVHQQLSQETSITKTEKDKYTRSNQFLIQTRTLINNKRKEVKELRSNSVSSIFAKIGGKHAAKLKKCEEELKDLLDRELKSAEGTRELKEIYDSHAVILAQLQQQKKDYDQLEGQLRQLLTNVFSGNLPGYPREYQLETEVNQRTMRIKQLQGSAQRYKSCFAFLNQALTSLNQATSSLGGADSMATLDIFMSNRRGYNTFVDVAKHQKIGAAKQLVQNANLNIQQARQLIPNLPYIQSSQVGTTGGDVIMDIMFDNVFTDIMMKQKIQKMRASVNLHQSRVNQVIAWINQQLTVHNNSINAEHRLYLVADRNLIRERMKMMDQIKKGGTPIPVSRVQQHHVVTPTAPTVPIVAATITQPQFQQQRQPQRQLQPQFQQQRQLQPRSPMMTHVVNQIEEEEEEEEIPSFQYPSETGMSEIQQPVEYTQQQQMMNVQPTKDEGDYAPSAPPVFKPYE